MKANIVKHPQGSPEWHQHRARSFNASDLAAAMGLSKYVTRAELIAQKATGIVAEVDDATQRRFDKGHEYESIARPWAEELVGGELFPIVLAAEVDGMVLSASLDGQDLMGEVTFEHKTASADLLASLDAGVIPPEYHPQMEQGLMLSGATRCLFMASAGDRESMRFAWYESDPALRAKIIPTWKQFAADLQSYVPPEVVDPVTPAHVESLPAVSVRMEGQIAVISNLDVFGGRLRAFIDGLPASPSTDQEFADAEQACKVLQKAQDALEQAEAAALAQTADIEQMRRTVADYAGLARSTRLALEKLVKARKEQIKVEIVQQAQQALQAHVGGINARLGKPYMPQQTADFGGAIKGKKTVTSMREAVDVTLANAKIAASEIGDRIGINLATLREKAGAHAFLFPDAGALVLKAPDDLAAVISARIGEHERAEAARLEAERARIRAEEEAKAKREAEAKLAAEQRAAAEAEAARLPRTAVVQVTPAKPHALLQNETVNEAEQPTMALGDINKRLGFVVTADFLASLGFQAAPVGAARKYRPSALPAICAALIRHLSAVANERKAA